MRVLFISDTRPHAHCYGTDNLIQGAYNVLGAENVYELPEKPNLHLPLLSNRDACQIDSDAWLPSKFGIALPVPDVAILTGAYGISMGALQSLPRSVPVVGLHYDDEATNTRPLLEGMLGRPLAAYWHREQPPQGARQLWLSQPLARVRRVADKQLTRDVFYYGSSHGLATRRSMVDSIRDAFPGCCCELTDVQTGRLPPEVYRERLWETRISPVWNSGKDFPVYQSNRLMESVALGCAVVAEEPPIGAATALTIEGVTYVSRPEDVGRACLDLAQHPKEAERRARLSQAHFVQRLASEQLFSLMVLLFG